MQKVLLTEQERAATGFTHKYIIPYTDFTSIASTGGNVVLESVTAGHMVTGGAFKLVTAFAGTSVTNVALDVGYDLAAGTDDPDAFIDNYEIAGAATEILYGDANGAAFATLRTGYCFLESADIECALTATGANLSALTAGEVHVYLGIVDLTKI